MKYRNTGLRCQELQKVLGRKPCRTVWLGMMTSVWPTLMTESLYACLRECALFALNRQKVVQAVCKSDGSLVTPVDQEIELLLRSFFKTEHPESLFVGEESVHDYAHEELLAAFKPVAKGGSGKDVWVVDPIDGTALYSFGLYGWGISIGLVQDGAMSAGIVLYPGLTVHDSAKLVVCEHGILRQSILNLQSQTSIASLQWTAIDALAPVEGYAGIIAVSHVIARKALYAGNHPFICTNCTVYSSNMLMRKAVYAYCARVRLWDIAAVWPMLLACGVKARTSSNQVMDSAIDPSIWELDPASPDFLFQKEHVLYWYPEQVDAAAFWNDLNMKPLALR